MSVLFTPASIGTLEINNRFVRSATGEGAATEGYLPATATRFYGRLAQGGTGLIITGHAAVRLSGRTQDSMTGIHADALIPSLREFTEGVRAHQCELVPGPHPARLVMQINHRGLDPPEAINQMPAAEVEDLVAAFVRAAGRVQEAGFDGVQIHAAHGYLVSQFLSPRLNQRADAWAGPRMAEAVLAGVRTEVGPDFPVLVKFNCDGLEDDLLTPDQSAAIAQCLERAGADAIEVSGTNGARQDIHTPAQEAYFAPYARRIREAVRIPVILVGGLRSMERMEEVIDEEVADFVSLCRPFIREPELVSRFWGEHQGNRNNPVAECGSCGLCWSSSEALNQCGVLSPEPAA